MKLKLIVPLFALIMFFGCSEQTDALEETSVNESLIMRGPNKPFKVSGSGTFAAGPNNDCTEYIVQINLEGSGNATLVGLYGVELNWCWNPPFAGGNNELYI